MEKIKLALAWISKQLMEKIKLALAWISKQNWAWLWKIICAVIAGILADWWTYGLLSFAILNLFDSVVSKHNDAIKSLDSALADVVDALSEIKDTIKYKDLK